MASSLLLPVVRARWPSALDSDMRIMPRILACRFSAASPDRLSSAPNASTMDRIGTVLACRPCRLARSSASVTE